VLRDAYLALPDLLQLARANSNTSDLAAEQERLRVLFRQKGRAFRHTALLSARIACDSCNGAGADARLEIEGFVRADGAKQWRTVTSSANQLHAALAHGGELPETVARFLRLLVDAD
jgi:hypothetical protein